MKKILLAIMLFSGTISVNAEEYRSALGYDEVETFIKKYSKKGKYTKEELVEVFARTKIKSSIIKQTKKQPEVKLTWGAYQKKVVSEAKIEKGKEFLIENESALKRAENIYGVPAEIITSIIGVETFYGKYKGNYQAINAISTMAFEGSKRRQSFFKKELEHFFDYCYANDIDPLVPKSSWAGAFGYPQFIPSSINSYAIDFDNDGKVDLLNSINDAIGSVGNYLDKNGWIKNNYIAEEVTNVDPNKFENMGGFNLNYQVQDLESNGVNFKRNMRKTKKLKLFKVKKDNEDHYMVGYQNFKSITTYNRSNLYALAIFDLANKLKETEVK